MGASHVATYTVSDGTVVGIEFEPVEGFVPAGFDEVAGSIRGAVEPVVAAARAVLARVRELSPDGVEVKFGVKVTGTASWLLAKAATEGNFEVTLSWRPAQIVAVAADIAGREQGRDD
jgi:hypothetical protein